MDEWAGWSVLDWLAALGGAFLAGLLVAAIWLLLMIAEEAVYGGGVRGPGALPS